MSRYLIVNVFEDCEVHGSSTPEVRTMNVSRDYAEKCGSWACGMEIAILNIFCELSHEATIYLLSRCRAADAPRPILQYSLESGLYGKGVGQFDIVESVHIREWLQDVYERQTE